MAIYILMVVLIILGSIMFFGGFFGIILKNKAVQEKRKQFVIISACLIIAGIIVLAVPSVYIFNLNLDTETGLLYSDSLEGAVAENNYEAVKTLLAEGANPNEAYQGFSNDAPLIHAVINNNLDIVKILLEYGADIEAQNKTGYTPLIIAASNKEGTKMLELLLEKGAKIGAKNNIGVTAIHIAAAASNLEAVKVLEEAGADIRAENIYGETCLVYACNPDKILPNIELIDYLVNEKNLQVDYTYLDGKIEKNLIDVLSENQMFYSQEYADSKDYDASLVSKTYTKAEKLITKAIENAKKAK